MYAKQGTISNIKINSGNRPTNFDFLMNDKIYPCTLWPNANPSNLKISNGMIIECDMHEKFNDFEKRFQYNVSNLKIIQGDYNPQNINRWEFKDIEGKVENYISPVSSKAPCSFHLISEDGNFKCKSWKYELSDGMTIRCDLTKDKSNEYIAENIKILDINFNISENIVISYIEKILKENGIKGKAKVTCTKIYSCISSLGNIDEILLKVRTDNDLKHTLLVNLGKLCDEKQLDVLSIGWNKLSSEFYLRCLGMTTKQINKMNKSNIEDLYTKILTNPFIVHSLSVEICLKICAKFKIPYTEKDVICARVSRQMYKYFKETSNTKLHINSTILKDNIADYEAIFEKHGIYCLDGFLTVRSIYDDQMSLFQNLNTISENKHLDIDYSVMFNDLKFNSLNGEQKYVISDIFHHGICIITGAGGVGKSFLTALLCRLLQLNNIAYQCTAFTGKAVSALKCKMRPFIGEEETDKHVLTLHKIICLSNQSNRRYNEYDDDTYYDDDLDSNTVKPIRNPKILIIDEASMVTGNLLNKFLNSYDRLDFKVIFVADPNQLKPFGEYGRPLVTLLQNKFCQIYELKQNNRCSDMGLLNIFSSIRLGTFNSIQNVKIDNFTWQNGDINKVTETYDRLRSYGIASKDICIITYSNPLVDKINAQCQIINRKYHSHLLENHETKYKVGDMVVCTKNNYSMNIMNGSTGLVTSLSQLKRNIYEYVIEMDKTQIYLKEFVNENKKKNKIEVVGYTINNVTVELGDNDDKEDRFRLSFSATCHKCQGSEYKYVIVFIDRNNPILDKHWLYTAVTRSKTNLYIISKSSDIDIIMNKKEVEYHDWFQDFIQGKYIVKEPIFKKGESILETKAKQLFENYVHPNKFIQIKNYKQEVINEDCQRYDGSLYFSFNNKDYILRLEYDGSQHFENPSQYQSALDSQKQQRSLNAGESLIRLSEINEYTSIIVTKVLPMIAIMNLQIVFMINYYKGEKLYNIFVYNKDRKLMSSYPSYLDFLK
jgi:hypothetical protein